MYEILSNYSLLNLLSPINTFHLTIVLSLSSKVIQCSLLIIISIDTVPRYDENCKCLNVWIWILKHRNRSYTDFIYPVFNISDTISDTMYIGYRMDSERRIHMSAWFASIRPHGYVKLKMTIDYSQSLSAVTNVI